MVSLPLPSVFHHIVFLLELIVESLHWSHRCGLWGGAGGEGRGSRGNQFLPFPQNSTNPGWPLENPTDRKPQDSPLESCRLKGWLLTSLIRVYMWSRGQWSLTSQSLNFFNKPSKMAEALRQLTNSCHFPKINLLATVCVLDKIEINSQMWPLARPDPGLLWLLVDQYWLMGAP